MQEFVICEPEGQYEGTEIEDKIFAVSADNRVTIIRGNLHDPTTGTVKPLRELPANLRAKVDGLMLLKAFLTAEDVELFPKLKVVVRMGVGYDRLDRKALAKRNVIVCNCPDYGTEEVADHAMAMVLALRRGIALYHDRLRAKPVPGDWQVIDSPLLQRIRGATFGILGLGRIGTAVALRAKAFGWNVIFYDPHVPNGYEKAIGVERVSSKEELFERATTISLHFPLTSNTRNIVSNDLLKLVQPQTVLVNTSRGETVDLDVVETALKSNLLAGAALDVVPKEPIEAQDTSAHSLIQAYRNSESWLEGRLILSPHAAYHSKQSVDEIRVNSAKTMRDVLLDGLMSNVIPLEQE